MPRRLALVHGFTQTASSWDPMVAYLPAEIDVIRPELAGHGGAGDDRLGFAETAAHLAETVGPAVYCGYSMGGRVCLRLALDHPEMVQALVLIGASPGLTDPEQRAARQRDDERLAADIAELGVTGFLEMWMAQPLFETTTPRPADVEARRANPAQGLAHALRAMGTGVMEPMWDRLADLSPPTRLLVGEHDAKFRDIAAAMAEATGPHVDVAVVGGAGHAVPLDEPATCARIVADFAEAHAW